jgi:hypothetical protein
MIRKFTVAICCVMALFSAKAQYMDANVLNGEFGVTAGAAHYFGDLNTNAALNRPKPTFGLMFRKQFGKYIGLRVHGRFAQLGYSDIYSKNTAQKARNLSFNTNMFELAAQGDFNFYRFIPGERGYRFTPYATIGLGFFTYDPYAYLQGTKYFLRPLGTEGQGSNLYPNKKPYGSMAMCFPVGAGIKYNISPSTNLTFEVTYRFTNTDYLDDVSSTYAGASAFPALPSGDNSPAFFLQDRSYETSVIPIGIAGRQRGISSQKDGYVTAELGVTFNLTSYKCPTPRY